jgi:MFS family permease
MTFVTTSLALLAPQVSVMYLVFVLAGIASAADGVAYVNLLVEMGEEKTRGYYIALGFTAMAPLRLAAPLFWGATSDHLTRVLGDPARGLAYIFLWGLLFQALGWLSLVSTVDDPRRPKQRIFHWKRGMVWPKYY